MATPAAALEPRIKRLDWTGCETDSATRRARHNWEARSVHGSM